MTLLLEVFWKSGVALTAALCINLLLRKRSADLRRVVLSATIVAIFAAAITLPWLPRWTAIVPAWMSTPDAPAALPVAVSTTHAATDTVRSQQPTPTPPRYQPVITSRQLPEWIPLLWSLGSALFLTRFALGLYGLRRIRRNSKPAVDTAAPRGVALLENDTIVSPVTWGILRPVILLPAGFRQLPAESRRAVLCHESAHIRSYDFFLRSLAEVVRAIIWFQPLMWMVMRQLREEQELACDDRVLAAGQRPSTYAKLLLDWDLRPGSIRMVAVGMAHRSCLKRRLHSLLDQEQAREQLGRSSMLTASILVAITVFPLAALSFTHASPQSRDLVRAAIPARQSSSETARDQFLQRSTILAQAVFRPLPQVVPQAAPTPADASPSSEFGPTFTTTSMLVTEQVVVTGPDGQSIEGLTAEDFVVMEDDKTMKVMLAEYQKVNDSGVSSYYVIGYYTWNQRRDGAYRAVRIALKNSNASLSYRTGYFGPQRAFVESFFLRRDFPAGTSSPAMIQKYEPAYSDEARKAKYSGDVTLFVTVDASGNATDIKVARPLGMGLDEKAVEAVSRWRFRPAMKDGQPIAVPVVVEVSFLLL